MSQLLVPGYSDTSALNAALDCAFAFKMQRVRGDNTITVSGIAAEVLRWQNSGTEICFDTRNVAKAFDIVHRMFNGDAIAHHETLIVLRGLIKDMEKVYPVVTTLRNFSDAYDVTPEANRISAPFTAAGILMHWVYIHTKPPNKTPIPEFQDITIGTYEQLWYREYRTEMAKLFHFKKTGKPLPGIMPV